MEGNMTWGWLPTLTELMQMIAETQSLMHFGYVKAGT